MIPHRFFVRSHARAVGWAADSTNNETHSHALASVGTFEILPSLGEFSDQRQANFVNAYD